MVKAAKVYGARTRTAKRRLKAKPKQEKPTWQRRNAARKAKQDGYAAMVAGAVKNQVNKSGDSND